MEDGKKQYKNLSPDQEVKVENEQTMANIKEWMRRKNIRGIDLRPLLKGEPTLGEVKKAIAYTAKLKKEA